MENKSKIIKYFIFSIVLSIFLFPLFTLAADDTAVDSKYPTIAGITIYDGSSAADVVLYVFNLLIAIGAFIAVVMVVMGGIEWMTSSGNVSKIESSKSKIKNALLGVAILVGSYFILTAINSNLVNVNISTLECIDGIRVQTQNSLGKLKDACINQDIETIGYDILSTKNWFMDEDSILKVYIYSEAGYKGTITAVDFGGDIAGAKSIYFQWKKPGFYFYTGADYQNVLESGVSKPFFTSTSVSNLGTYSFENVASSIQKLNPDNTVQNEAVFYRAVVFEDVNYSGRCSFVGDIVPNVATGASVYYPTPVSDNQISSLVVTKSYGNESKNRGTVTFYSGLNCGEESSVCVVDSSSSGPTPQNTSTWCSTHGDGVHNKFGSGDFIQSFKITGQLGVVLMTGEGGVGSNSGSCQYWDINNIPSSGTCYSNVKGKSVYNDACWGGSSLCPRPRSFMVFPVDKK